MKILSLTAMLATSIGTAALFSSCVDPYAQGYGSTQVTTYRPGYEVRALPRGYRTERVDGNVYYTHEGQYYRSRGGRYVVVDPPKRNHYRNPRPGSGRDVVITKLPRNHRVVDYRGSRYYQVNDVYYQRRGPGYIIVDRPR